MAMDKKKKSKNKIIIVIQILCVLVFVVSASMIAIYFIRSKEAADNLGKFEELVNTPPPGWTRPTPPAGDFNAGRNTDT